MKYVSLVILVLLSVVVRAAPSEEKLQDREFISPVVSINDCYIKSKHFIRCQVQTKAGHTLWLKVSYGEHIRLDSMIKYWALDWAPVKLPTKR